MKYLTIFLTSSIYILFIIADMGCRKNSEGPVVPVNADTVVAVNSSLPRFITRNYIDLDKIGRISRFRSGIGHDYSDNFEQCRSMKHYFEPKQSGVDWASVQVYSPIHGVVMDVQQEWAGARVQIRSLEQAKFSLIIFHINLQRELVAGDTLISGDILGKHIGSQTMSDISVGMDTLVNGNLEWKFVSYFDLISDSVFSLYHNRGVPDRDTLIISLTTRDAHPLQCSGDTFQGLDSLNGWIQLH